MTQTALFLVIHFRWEITGRSRAQATIRHHRLHLTSQMPLFKSSVHNCAVDLAAPAVCKRKALYAVMQLSYLPQLSANLFPQISSKFSISSCKSNYCKALINGITILSLSLTHAHTHLVKCGGTTLSHMPLCFFSLNIPLMIKLDFILHPLAFAILGQALDLLNAVEDALCKILGSLSRSSAIKQIC